MKQQTPNQKHMSSATTGCMLDVCSTKLKLDTRRSNAEIYVQVNVLFKKKKKKKKKFRAHLKIPGNTGVTWRKFRAGGPLKMRATVQNSVATMPQCNIGLHKTNF